jgi:hypothetical protein
MKLIIEKKAVTAFYSWGEPKRHSHVKGAMFMQKIAQDHGFVNWQNLVDTISKSHELPFTTTTDELKLFNKS